MFLQRSGKEDSLIANYTVDDIKEKEFDGKKFYEVGVSMGKDANGENLPIVNVAIWGRKIDIKKGDRILAVGKLKVTKKDDKTYYSLTADFVAKEDSLKIEVAPQPELSPTEDDDLPF